ncbi:MAG TPA: hypothetical protein VG498_23550 [Terriglobales bacterium]|nr:hypothetical protein [Terriglobales bacterium]
MRQIVPVLLVVLVGVLLVPRATADIPGSQVCPQSARSLVNDNWLHARDGHFLEPLEPHPFATEFYLHQFASENDRQDSRWRLHLNPMLRSLSKRIAGWPHALVRLMP